MHYYSNFHNRMFGIQGVIKKILNQLNYRWKRTKTLPLKGRQMKPEVMRKEEEEEEGEKENSVLERRSS